MSFIENENKLINKSIGRNLGEARLAKGYTREEVAARLNLEASCIAQYEKGEIEDPSIYILLKFAELYSVMPSQIFEWPDISKDNSKTQQINNMTEFVKMIENEGIEINADLINKLKFIVKTFKTN